MYEPSKRRITWSNRSWATVYSDDEPDQLRGFSGDTAWVDEMAKFVNAEDTWHCLQFGMRERSSDRPRILITTTPRPLSILRQIERLPSTVVITGSSYENARNLDPHCARKLMPRYSKTCLARCGRVSYSTDADFTATCPTRLPVPSRIMLFRWWGCRGNCVRLAEQFETNATRRLA
jgi:phage terminase large subunit-like protein